MTTDHPMTPSDAYAQNICREHTLHEAVKRAYTDGADAELQAIERWFFDFYQGKYWRDNDLKKLREVRRPRPLTTKQRAIKALKAAVDRGDCITQSPALPVIYEALEAMNDD